MVAGEAAAPATVIAGSASDRAAGSSAECPICLEGHPELLPRGCACRGSAGVAHVDCLVKLAQHHALGAEPDSDSLWWKCGTCLLAFGGQMNLALSKTRWDLAQKNRGSGPRALGERMTAAANYAVSLNSDLQHSKAAGMQREVLETETNLFGPNHPTTLLTKYGLALSLKELGRHVEAEVMLSDVLRRRKRTIGPTHNHTLETANTLASARRLCGDIPGALALFRETIAAGRDAHGLNHIATLVTTTNFANLLSYASEDRLGRLESAVLIHDTLRRQTQVLGASHKDTMLTAAGVAIHAARTFRWHSGQLSEGCAVVIKGLVSRADLNGVFGIVSGKETSTGRWPVAVSDHSAIFWELALKPETLTVLA